MDAEQLRMILDTIKSVAGTAGTAGVVWICIHYFVQLIMAIAAPICWVVGVVMTARYASTFFGTRAQTASADEIEKTKQRVLEVEKAKVEAGKHDAVKQLVMIAQAAGASHSQYSGLYHSADLEKIIKKVREQ